MLSRVRPCLPLLASLLLAAPGPQAPAATVEAVDAHDIEVALARLKPGDTLNINSGTYSGSILARHLVGRPGRPITIRGANPAAPPLFQFGDEAWHFAGCSHLHLQHLRVTGCSQDGIRIDDDQGATPSRHIVIDDVMISEIGAQGAHNALQLGGVTDFAIRRCQFEGWGGDAVDLVGCQRGRVEDCRFIGRDNSTQAGAVHIRGGSSNVLVQTSFFRWAGEWAITIGGRTDPADFRPRDAPYEATAVEVGGNRFFGSQSPIVWNTADGGRVHHNTIVFPHQWVIRVLQENTDPRFPPCGHGVFAQNVMVLDARVASVINIRDGAAAETFRFQSNAWFRTTGPRPLRLPVDETDGVLQVDPDIPVEGPQAFHVRSPDPRLQGLGADHYVPVAPPRNLL